MQSNYPQRPLDRRQRKSREAIQNALLTLLRDKPLDQITISELSAKADVNRKTFYNNYHNIQEVRDEPDNRYLDIIFSLIGGDGGIMLTTNPEDFFLGLFHGLHTNLEQCRLIFDSGEYSCLAGRLKEMIIPYLDKTAADIGMSRAVQSYVVEYTVNGLSSLINMWLHSDVMLSDEEIAHLAAGLVRSGADSVGY